MELASSEFFASFQAVTATGPGVLHTHQPRQDSPQFWFDSQHPISGEMLKS